MYSDFYEIQLPALRFEKVEEYLTKVNDTEENDARPRQKQISKRQKGRYMTLIATKETQSQPQVNDTQNTNASRNDADRKRTSISAFKKTVNWITT